MFHQIWSKGQKITQLISLQIHAILASSIGAVSFCFTHLFQITD